ncbi:MAG: SDR family NAD(P)-dependent oxidoreductase, partial [Anaerolineae bacterium]|nr:SDR family NAD(P)-dependent oxidoreductase [Anaerolineae bacterium]
MQVTRIDLDPDSAPDHPALLAELHQSDTHEPQIAFRGGVRYAPRLESSRLSPAAALLEGDQPFILDIAERGVLDNLTFRPYPRQMPQSGEIEIRVHATGLNFRDVLNALGMYPGDPGLLGNECAGEVVVVGPDVQDIRVGDRVMAAAYGTFTRYVTVAAALAIRIPDHLSYEEAATIPITYLTAYYALHHLAGMKAGDKVLIHAAAGGVGIAAVQLARRAGAEIFGTAGSPVKRDYLTEIGVHHSLNSRTLDFADDIRAITAGEGVDIILNSLTGDFIPNSLSVLHPGGHFLEIGKGGIWDSDQVEAFAPGTHYAIIYLGDILNTQPDLTQSMLRDIVQGLEDGSLEPLPLQVFPLSEAVNAFRFMAQARHIGKIVLSQDVRRGQLSPDASYLITGGTSGIGLEVARWMVGQGARYLALASRRGMTPDAAALVEEMAAQDVVIRVFAADVAQEADVRSLLDEIAVSLPPLRGIIHSAGVNADAPLLKQDSERLETVLRPKADGAAYLSDLTRDLNLDFFVLFSSVAAIVGWAGQSNYAAANACLDALAHQRRGQGLPATSINWGIWDNTGMAAVLSDQDKARWARQGLKPFSPAEGLNALKHILEESPVQTVAIPINWRVFLNEHSSPFYEAFAVRAAPVVAAPPAQAALLLKLAETPPSRHYNVLSGFIRDQAVQVLGLEPGQAIDPLLPLNQLGLDSLMAVELRNALALNTGLTLPATLLFDYPTIDALVQYLMGRIEPPKAEETAATPEPLPESSTDEL